MLFALASVAALQRFHCCCSAALTMRADATHSPRRPSDQATNATPRRRPTTTTKLNETNDGEHQAQQEGAGVRCPPAFCLCLALSVLAALSLSHASSPQHALAHCNNSSAVDVGVSVVVKLPYYANTHKTHAKAKHKSKHTHTQRKIAQKHVQQMRRSV